jgi:hypothetical protein
VMPAMLGKDGALHCHGARHNAGAAQF